MAYHARIASIVLLSVFLSAGQALAEDFSRTFSIAPAPAWVKEAGPEMIVVPSKGTDDSSICLLADYQENAATGELYSRFVDEARTMDGVENLSTITADYDPSYQTLIFHHIRVVRDGKTTSRLARDAVSLLRRETDLEMLMLDGSVTASIVLKDVRPGDRIDYAYTIKGRNPVMGGKYANSFTYHWAVSVGRERIRVVSPASRPLTYQTVGGDLEPRVTTSKGVTEYLWELSDAPPVPTEDGTPSWTITNPWIEVTEYADWSSVASWALTLYPPAKLSKELESRVAQWTSRTTDPLERVEDALDYVQQEIRYLGIELGVGSYKPRPPSAIDSQRFGDCKDKAYLLCTLLGRMGIEAHPVLVNTYSGPILDRILPSPFVFDHVVAAVTVDDTTLYLDPTRSYQRGPVEGRFMPDYGFALVVAPGQKGLVELGTHQGDAPEIELLEKFTVKGQEEPAELEVTTTAHGGAAESLRAQFASGSTEDISRDYLDYYAASYPKIETAGDLDVKDDTDGNVFTTVEKYTIPGFWTLKEDEEEYEAEIFPDTVYGEIPMPRTKKRTTPFEVDYPRTVHERIRVMLPETWPIDDEKETIETAAFTLETSVRHQDSKTATTVLLDYTYRAKAREVAVPDVPDYNQEVKNIDSKLGYVLTWDAGTKAEFVQPTNEESASEGRNMFLIGLGAILLIAGGSAASRWAARRRQARMSSSPLVQGATPVPIQGIAAAPAPGAALDGLGGWLVAAAIGLLILPMMNGRTLTTVFPYISAGTWRDLTDPAGGRYNPLWAPYLIESVASSIAFMAGSVFLLVMFFQRRRLFRVGSIVLLCLEAVSAAAGILFAAALSAQAGVQVSDPLMDGTISVVALMCIAGIPYLLISRRVKNTFTR